MLKAIIIDDERHARESIKLILEKHHANVEILGMAESVAEAIIKIKEFHPDLIFLDIDMPDGNGFEVIEAFDNPDFEVIFVTAYGNYAIKAIKISALDYIVKPIEPSELLDAVHKAHVKKQNPGTTHKQLKIFKDQNKKVNTDKVVLPTEEGYVFVELKDIIRCEADSNYTKFYLSNGSKILVSRTLKEYDDILSENSFFRIHNSHLINLSHVRRYLKGKGGFVILSDGSSVEVSVRKKSEFLEVFSNF